MKRISTIAVLLIGVTYVSLFCAAQNESVVSARSGVGEPKGLFSISPEQRKWEAPDEIGRQRSVVFGDPTKPGLYGTFVKWPPNAMAKAHSHPDERYGLVVSGMFYLGHGNKFDPKKLESHSAGTVFSEPAGVAHFGATKGPGVILYFVGIGPDRTDPIEK
jgi:uncharacterized RmlC-like cupin family protein